jgi:tetratricopeptide (TPR) repeat protein
MSLSNITAEARRYRQDGSPGGARGLVAGSPALVPGLLAIGAMLALGAAEAGFQPAAWYAGALFMLALLTVAAVALPAPARLPRALAAALCLLAAFTAWSYLSIAWASAPGPAWDGANRAAFYLLVFALFALWPLEARGAGLLLGILGAGIAAIGLVELLRANAAADAGHFFLEARFAQPAGYMNANAALWTLGAVPCLHLASRRGPPALLRGLFLGSAGLLCVLALMAQSRGWLLALPLALVVYLLLVPGRLRSAACLLAVAAGVLAVHAPVLAVHDKLEPGGLGALLADATRSTLLMALALVVVGTLGAVVDRLVEPGSRTSRGLSLAAGVLVALVAVAAVAGTLATVGQPGDEIADAWRDFRQGAGQAQIGTSRFTTAGTNRYDFWSVAWELFRDHPLRGAGSANFQEDYLLRGNSLEQPRFPHSLELGVLSQTGLVGFLLLAAAVSAALVAARHAWQGDLPRRAAVAGLLFLFAYWLAHASVDWFWEFPGVTAAAFMALGASAALAPRSGATTRRAPRRALLLALPAALLALSFVLPWLATMYVDRAAGDWRTERAGALQRLDRAESLNPLDVRAQLTAAAIALRAGDRRRTEAELRDALEREPRNAYARLELGAILAYEGDRRDGERILRSAVRLTPRDPVPRQALRAARRGRPLSPALVNTRIITRVRRLGQNIR